jgi:hypothetical protein
LARARIIRAVWSRRLLEERVAFLAENRDTFVAEVERLAGELDGDEREILGEILLARAKDEGVFAEAYERRVGAKGWFRRQWDRASQPR